MIDTPAGVCAWLLATAEDALAACGREPVTSFVGAGLIAWDDCCGMLVAAPERIYRTASFPIEGVDTICETGEITMDCVVLLVRCVPVLDDRGEAPTADEMEQAYTALLVDAAIIWNALAGALPTGWSRANLTQTFVGAEGGCVGVETRVTLGVDEDRWCPDCP